jgi:hypothetical protein
MADAGYTFLPWCRRGIVAELDAPDTDGALDPRAVVRIGITITNAGAGGVDVTLFGPGDVLGLDQRLIVRTEPRPGTTAFEPNHLAAIDFDLPDLPWLVTPAAPNSDVLRPWLALVVVEQQPGVSVGVEAGVPLPVLRIARPADALVELPDPATTALWAHAQVLGEADITPGQIPAEIAARPDENVSRLVCPRRLRPGVRYFACIVPTFDAGAIRGLGGTPVDGPLGPAWGGTSEARLPVYYHWEFATGPEGDFETLAGRLRPHESSARVGRAPMHVGVAQPGAVEMAAADEGSVVPMDGALRAPAAVDLTLEEVSDKIRNGLRSVVNAAKATAVGEDTEPATVGPPLYGSWHANRHELAPDAPDWLVELNTDPRTRVAAGLGAEVVRRNQEDLMHAAWTQLGDIRQANDRLNAARLSFEALRKVHARHLAPLPPERLVPLASPVHRHTLVAAATAGTSLTIPAAVHPTSLPDAALSPALRRLTSERRPLLRAAARRSGRQFTSAVLARLAPGSETVDPNRFVPDGLVTMASLDRLNVPPDLATPIDLAAVGVSGTFPADRLLAQRDRAARLDSMAISSVAVTLRPTIAATGLVTGGHLDAIASLPGLDGERQVQLLGELTATASTQPGAAAFLVTGGGTARATIDVLDLAPDGTVTVRTPPDVPNAVVGTIDPGLVTSRGDLAAVLGSLGPSAIDRTGASVFAVRTGAGGRPTLEHRPVGGLGGGGLAGGGGGLAGGGLVGGSGRAGPGGVGRGGGLPGDVDGGGTAGGGSDDESAGDNVVVSSLVLQPLLTDAATVGRFGEAFTALEERLHLPEPPETRAVVAFDLATAATAIIERTDPRRTVAARMATIVRIDGLDFRTPRPGMSLAPTEDRIVASPQFDVPSYLYLARYDRSRFCPGIDEIPPDSVTILETNPRFVEAFLIGLNHEMNRELLWRTYPTDQRATAFRRFWDRFDGRPDLGPIDEFGPGRVGTHLVDAEPKLVLLIRGELLRRYPTAAIYAVRATPAGRLSTAPEDVASPIFGGSFDPDITFVGFDLADHQLDDGDGWFFVIQEQPTEPRFGLDDQVGPRTDPVTEWADATWADTGLEPGAHLVPSAISAVGLGPLPHAGAIAAAFFQQPVRVAVHARHLVAGDS